MHGNDESQKTKTFLKWNFEAKTFTLLLCFSYSPEERREKWHLELALLQDAAARQMWRAAGFSGQKANGERSGKLRNMAGSYLLITHRCWKRPVFPPLSHLRREMHQAQQLLVHSTWIWEVCRKAELQEMERDHSVHEHPAGKTHSGWQL